MRLMREARADFCFFNFGKFFELSELFVDCI